MKNVVDFKLRATASPRRGRRGLAAFEFMFLMPIWVLFLCLLLHVAQGGINSIKVTNQTRYDLWKQRDQGVPKDVEPMVWKSSKQQGQREASSAKDIRTGTYFDRWKNRFVSNQTLYTNSWDSASVQEKGFKYSASKKMNARDIYYNQISGKLTRFGEPDITQAESAAAAQNNPNVK